MKGILQLLESTQCGMVKEIGVWPIEKRIWYQRLMLYQNLITSYKERLGRIIIEHQREQIRKNWCRETERIASRLKVKVQWAEEMTKAIWKKEVKNR